MENEAVTLLRDCAAKLIPSGDEIYLQEGSRVYVTQALGGSLTVRNDIGMFHISPADADAFGPEVAESIGLAEPSGAGAGEADFSEDRVWDSLRTCYDPEIPVNIVDLGLIYDLAVAELESGMYDVDIKMTLTAQGCGMGPVIAADAKAKIELLPAVGCANVDIVWAPPWNPHMISSEGRTMLGLD